MQAIAQSVYQYHAASREIVLRCCSRCTNRLCNGKAVSRLHHTPAQRQAARPPARHTTSQMRALCFVPCALCFVPCASVPSLRLLSFPAPQQGRLGGHEPTSAVLPNMAAYNTARSAPASPSSTRQTVHALKLVLWNSCPGAGPGTGPGTTAGHCPNGRSLSTSRLMRNGRMAGVCSARPPRTIQRVNAWR
jgi:hypothetical protein